VNVEAQSVDPHSLLNSIRRALAVRRQHQAFGRGTLRFLRPQNRKILAYLREHEGETILCVANVSRTAQAVELDLSEFAGRVPVELSGATTFPTIGQLTYLLTLQPYGAYWFQLCKDIAGPSWSTAMASAPPEQHTFVLREDAEDLVEAGNRRVLERDVLPDYVAQRRWFDAKHLGVQRVNLAAWSPLPGGKDQILAEFDVETPAGTSRYALPLAAAWDAGPVGPFAPNLALGRVRRGSRMGMLTDAFANPAFPLAVLGGVKAGARIPCSDGELVFERLGDLAVSDEPTLEWIAAEQSNSTVMIENQVVLKLLRKVEAGPHPEAEMTRALTERGFRNTPPLLGEVVRIDAEGRRRTLMVLQGYVYSQGDAWIWTQNYIERVADDQAAAQAENTAPAFAGYAAFARTLGTRLAEMHAALAQPTEDPAFAPEAAGEADVRDWIDGVQRQLAEAWQILAPDRGQVGEDVAELAAGLLARREALEAAVERLGEAGAGALRIRIHGDLHLGQVLVTGSDATIIDFEGEPRRSLEERRRKSSPMRDVAGVLRSFDYAAAFARRGLAPEPRTAEQRLGQLLDDFRQIATRAFLDGYVAGAGEITQPLLDLFLLEKAAYEVAYEAASRPTWVPTPLRGLAALADRILGGAAS
jgi:maltose alpha-D-glucosyltransferase/alpha-amylase